MPLGGIELTTPISYAFALTTRPQWHLHFTTHTIIHLYSMYEVTIWILLAATKVKVYTKGGQVYCQVNIEMSQSVLGRTILNFCNAGCIASPACIHVPALCRSTEMSLKLYEYLYRYFLGSSIAAHTKSIAHQSFRSAECVVVKFVPKGK